MRVVIVGAGIAGPVLGAFLSKARIESVLLEGRAAPTGDEGGFLGVAPNGMRVLAELGLAEAVERAGVVCHRFSFLNAGGREVGAIDRANDRQDFGVPLVMVKRGHLHRILLEHAAECGVRVRHGARLAEIDRIDPSRVVARFEDGSEEAGGALVGCDGLRSRARSLLFPNAPPPEYTGLLDFGGYARVQDIELPACENVMVFGKRAFFGAFRAPPSADGTSEVWWFHNGGGEPVRDLAPAERRTRILELHREDPPFIRACVDATPEVLGPWPLHEVGALDRWHEGNVGVIGDAAHATSPSAGQGASLALEDAMTLARCLRDEENPDRAFAELERLRMKRVAEIVKHSRRNSSAKAMPGPVTAWVRDRMLPLFIKLGDRAQREAYAYRIAW